MEIQEYLDLKEKVIAAGFLEEINYYKDPGRGPVDSCGFALETIWVILNSGMKNQVARKLFPKIKLRLLLNRNFEDIFKHEGKTKAILKIWNNRHDYFLRFRQLSTDDTRLEFLESLPFIGPITKYHLAKNFGMDVAKPDRHLVRIAEKYYTSPGNLCRKLSQASGDLIAMVDYVLWRAANLKFI